MSNTIASEDRGEVERDMSGETVCGFRVAAYRETDPVHGDKFGHRYCEHWSTPNSRNPRVKVERLFTEDQLRAALTPNAITDDGTRGWRDMASAPKDGSRFIARGHDWGRQDNPYHVAEAVWNAEREEWRSAYDPDAALAYLTEWLCAAPHANVEKEAGNE